MPNPTKKEIKSMISSGQLIGYALGASGNNSDQAIELLIGAAYGLSMNLVSYGDTEDHQLRLNTLLRWIERWHAVCGARIAEREADQ